MATAAGQAKDGLSFGPFSLVASERLLTKDGAPVELGARALDILIALLPRPNEVVSKKDLMSRVWPDVTVEEGSLRFHMASLRKALGDGKNGARYITTLAGRGYCFVAPVSRPSRPRDAAPLAAVELSARQSSRPPGPDGRARRRRSQAVGPTDRFALCHHRRRRRRRQDHGCGSGRHHLIEAFAGAVLFVDLGMLSDPKLVATAVASMLGLSVQSDDATPSLIAYLRDKRILLILDTCEHLVEAVAALAARIIEAAPQVHILATSREALQDRGRARLQTGCAGLSAGRSGAHRGGGPGSFRQPSCSWSARSQAARVWTSAMRKRAIVASICRKLDGVALAIELAARRVEILRPAADRRAARPAPDAAVAGVAHGAAAPEDAAGHAGLELRAPVRTGARGASPARHIRRTFHARCGAGGRDERERSIKRSSLARSTASSPSRWWRPVRSGP